MLIRRNIVVMLLLSATPVASIAEETLLEKLQRAYNEGYNAGYKDGADRSPGGTGSGTVSPTTSSGQIIYKFATTGDAGTSSKFELPEDFAIAINPNSAEWTMAKIMEKLKSGENITAKGFYFKNNYFTYGETPLLLDESTGRPYLEKYSENGNLAWKITDNVPANVLSDYLNLQSEGFTEGLRLDSISGASATD